MEDIKKKLLLTKGLLPQKFNFPSILRLRKAMEMYELVIAEIPDEARQLRMQCSINLDNIKHIVDIGLSASSWKKTKVLLHQARCSMDDHIGIAINTLELQNKQPDQV